MSVPDNQREGSNVFDIDDALWDERTGVLNDTSKKEIIKLVETELAQLVNGNQKIPANFANNLAVNYLKGKAHNAPTLCRNCRCRGWLRRRQYSWRR